MTFAFAIRRAFSIIFSITFCACCLAADPPKGTPTPAKLSTTDPLKALGSSLKLPPIGEAKGASILAKTEVTAEAVVLIDLLGGKAAIPERGVAWELTAESPEAANRRWRFELKRDRETEPKTLANLSLTEGALRFQWTEEAVNEPLAGTLANCALKIAAGKALKTTSLRRPIEAKAWSLSLSEEVSNAYEIETPPPRQSLKIEMSLSVPKETTRYRFVGSSTIAPGEATIIELMGRRTSGALRVRIEAEWKRDRLELDAVPQLAISEKKSIKLTPNLLKRELSECNESQERLKRQESGIAKQVASAKKGKSKVDTSAADRALAQIRAELKALAALETRLKEASDLMDDEKLKLPLSVRVFHQADEASIVLVTPAN